MHCLFVAPLIDPIVFMMSNQVMPSVTAVMLDRANVLHAMLGMERHPAKEVAAAAVATSPTSANGALATHTRWEGPTHAMRVCAV